MPTNMSTAELRTLDKNVRDSSFFSARTMLEDLLQGYKDKVTTILNPTVAPRPDTGGMRTVGLDFPTARLQIKDLLRSLSYAPAEGEAGTIKDLSSDARINLVLQTNTDLAQGWGQKRQGQDPTLLDEWPAQELFRAEDRKVKRDWPDRWRIAGTATGRELGDGWTMEGGRMIALKNHEIWDELGSSDNFDDALDVDYPPFAFNSGMWVRDIRSDVAEQLGLLDSDSPPITPDLTPFLVAGLTEILSA